MSDPVLQRIDLNRIELFACQYLEQYLRCNVPEFHREIYSDLEELEDGAIKRLLVEAPRDFAKSTILSVIFPLYLICESNFTELMSFSRAKLLSQRWLDRIKRELERNELIWNTYGVEPNGDWTKGFIQYKRKDGHEGEFIAASKGMSPRGFRPQVVIVDDPQNKQDVTSEMVINTDLDWFFEDMINVLEPEDRMVFMGTRMSPLSLLSTVADLQGWTVRSYRAFDNDGHSIWPEKWSDEALTERRTEIGEHRFSSEYMNEPFISENPVFDKDWFQFYERNTESFKKMVSEGMYTVVGIDPAVSLKESADNTALVTVSATYGKKPDYYVRKSFARHLTMKQTAEQTFLHFEEFQQHKTIVEDVAYQKALLQEISEMERVYRKNVNLVPVRPDRDKLRRAFAVQSLFQEGRVFFDKTDPEIQKLMNEMIMFDGQGVYKDDRVDAFTYALNDLKKWTLGHRGGKLKSALSGSW